MWIEEAAAGRGRGARLHGRRRRVGDRHAPDRDDPPRTPTSCSPARRRSKLLDALKERNAAAVEEVVPDKLGVGEVQRVLQHLLREGVSIRDLGIDPRGDRRPRRARRATRPPLAEYARQALARTITAGYLDDERTLRAISLDPTLEQEVAESLAQTPDGEHLAHGPGARRRRVVGSLAGEVEQATRHGRAAGAALLEPHPPPPATADRAGVPAAAGRLLQRDPAGDPRRVHRSRGRLGLAARRQGAHMPETRTYQGASLEELLPQIRAELGADAP